ncbi:MULTISPECIES: ABC transporter ATP-binding protein [unclassified Bifidobacterium]|uniref:ABC transporter ATP-binding protein n=1 Tax=unclassified Bifidobacterium TaxID=2608897 RepID=UPI00226B18FA|nr:MULTISPECIES: ABC transporter ATP-binding protein [unclassified Bifidobacterium]
MSHSIQFEKKMGIPDHEPDEPSLMHAQESGVDKPADHSGGPSVVANGISLVVSPRKGDTLTILDHIDFQAWPGQVTGIVGPSGSGKSSLLYCLAGLEEVTEGSVSLLGKEITHIRVASLTRFRRKHLGFVFQSYNLITSMTVEENLALPFTLRGSLLPRKKADDLLRYFGLAEQKKRSVTLLSGGEQQRVALARVLLSDADIVFADEPTGALDQQSGTKVITILSDLARRSGKTVILVTHSAEVADHCDRIVEVRDGRLEPNPGNAVA